MISVRKAIAFAGMLVLGVAGVRPAAAQVTSADSAAVLLGAANQLRMDGRTGLSTELLQWIVRHYPGTPAAIEAERLLSSSPRIAENRPGRTELLVWSTLYGAALGIAVPAAFEVDKPAIYGLGLIAGAPAGFFAARALTRDRFISEGQARAITFGGLWGAWQGFGWVRVLGSTEHCTGLEPDPNAPRFCYNEDPSWQAQLRATIAGSLAGVGTGLILSRKPINSGVATTVNFGALWGTWFGTVAEVVRNNNGDNELLLPLIGGDAGLIATALLAPKWDLSRNRARLISVSGLAGGLAGAGLLLIVESDGDKAILLPAVGSALGLAAGAYWTRNYDEMHGFGERGGGDALLNFDGRKLALELPAPSLTLLAADEAGRTRVPAVHVPLLKARF